MRVALIGLLALCGCVTEPASQAPAAQMTAEQVIVLDGVSYAVEQKENVPLMEYVPLGGGDGAFLPSDEQGRAVWISGAPTLLDAFRALTVFCEGRDPGPPAPDAPDTDMVPTVPGTDTFQFDGSCG